MTRAELVELVQSVPESQVNDLATLIEAYRTHDRVLVQSLLAPEVVPESDETPVTAEEIRDAESFDQVCAELGLL